MHKFSHIDLPDKLGTYKNQYLYTNLSRWMPLGECGMPQRRPLKGQVWTPRTPFLPLSVLILLDTVILLLSACSSKCPLMITLNSLSFLPLSQRAVIVGMGSIGQATAKLLKMLGIEVSPVSKGPLIPSPLLLPSLINLFLRPLPLF